MRNELYPFQKKAVWDMRMKAAAALSAYRSTRTPQILSLQAPTGSGKTIMMAALIEEIFFGSSEVPSGETGYSGQPEAIFVWLSDSPELNLQSKEKIDFGSDKLPYGVTTIIDEANFDRETLEDGKIYFLNTQKLSVSGNLTKKGDRRHYTIWETLANTAQEKSDHLYFIIDEAHRGMQGNAAGRATSIMQRFLIGYPAEECDMPPMPFVIGMSATAERFNRLAAGLTSTTHHTRVSAEEVRSSGLLKDRIIINYPEDAARQDDMALLGAATREWMDKCAHWGQYCREQHAKRVEPVLVIQVKSGSSGAVSDTNLDDVLSVIETNSGLRFTEGEVVHTFGSIGAVTANGLQVLPIEPNRIPDADKVKIVLFKENLSTGWDCPRAETMMSFRTANDSTYIAQLLGRMIRTPLQQRVRADESLNEVRLFLPYFDVTTVNSVIEELRSPECGDIPVDVESESVGNRSQVMVSAYPKWRPVYDSNQKKVTFVDCFSETTTDDKDANSPEETSAPDVASPDGAPATNSGVGSVAAPTAMPPANDAPMAWTRPCPVGTPMPHSPAIDRAAIIKAINLQGLLTYIIRDTQVKDYLSSLVDLAGFLSRTGLESEAQTTVNADVAASIHAYIEKLHAEGRYDDLADAVLQFKLSVTVFDPFGKLVSQSADAKLAYASHTDLDRMLRDADIKLGNAGFPKVYGGKYTADDDNDTFVIDAILFAAEQANIDALHAYAKEKFHALNDKWRGYISQQTEECQSEYGTIVANGDPVSKHGFVFLKKLALNMTVMARIMPITYMPITTGLSPLNSMNGKRICLKRKQNALILSAGCAICREPIGRCKYLMTPRARPKPCIQISSSFVAMQR